MARRNAYDIWKWHIKLKLSTEGLLPRIACLERKLGLWSSFIVPFCFFASTPTYAVVSVSTFVFVVILVIILNYWIKHVFFISLLCLLYGSVSISGDLCLRSATHTPPWWRTKRFPMRVTCMCPLCRLGRTPSDLCV